ncbi:MAG: SIR2 family protein [Elusimicrobiota bacterium]
MAATKIIQLLTNPDTRVAILCGAGISVSSGIPDVTTILETCLAALGADPEDAQLLRQSDGTWRMPFESFMDAFIEHDKNTELFGIFMLGEPNANHYLIRELASKKRLAVISTTNFDVLIERALREHPNIDFQIVLPNDSQRPDLASMAPLPLVKLHGTADQPRTIRSTVQSISGGTEFTSRQALVRQVLESGADVLWVWGYSVSDFLDISPAIAAATSSMIPVLLLQHDPNIRSLNDAIVEPLDRLTSTHPFARFFGFTVRVDADAFTETVFGKRETNFNRRITSAEWSAPIRRWLDSFPHSHVRYSILCHLFYITTDYSVALKYNSLALDASRAKDPRGTGAALSNRGLILYKIGQVEVALSAFRKALALFQAIEFPFGIATSYNSLGYALGHSGLRAEGYKYLAIGLNYVATHEFAESRLCEGYLRKSRGELNVLDSAFEAADNDYDRALYLFRAGYKAEEAEVLMLKARLYWLMNRRDEARALLHEARELATAVGNREVVVGSQQLSEEIDRQPS